MEMKVSESSTTRKRSVLNGLGLWVTASITMIAATSASAVTSHRMGKWLANQASGKTQRKPNRRSSP